LADIIRQHSQSAISQFEIIGPSGQQTISLNRACRHDTKAVSVLFLVSLLELYHAQDGAFPEISSFPIDNSIHPGEI
jgi:hypothetical protein